MSITQVTAALREPILGVTALASTGIEVYPRAQRLERLPTVRPNSARPGRTSKGG